MVAEARRLSPVIDFRRGDLLALDLADGALGGIAAFYSIIHVPRAHLPRAFAEFHRVLRPGGSLLLALHLGEPDKHLDELWGRPVSLDFLFFSRDEIERHLAEAGFALIESHERPPYPEVEYPSHRAYFLAWRPVLASPGAHSRVVKIR